MTLAPDQTNLPPTESPSMRISFFEWTPSIDHKAPTSVLAVRVQEEEWRGTIDLGDRLAADVVKPMKRSPSAFSVMM